MHSTFIARSRARTRFGALALLAIGMAVPAVAATSSAASAAAPPATLVAYNSIDPGPPVGVTAVAYEGTGTSELGDLVQLANGPRALTSVTVELGSYGCEVGSGASCITTPGKTFDHPLTLTLYSVTNVGGVPTPGPAVATLTKTVSIPYRPTFTPSCATSMFPTGYLSAIDNACHTNVAVPVTFDFPANPIVPTSVIWGLAFNTTHFGRADLGGPLGPQPCASNCGYDSLNLAISAAAAPSAGVDVDSNSAFVNSIASFYCDLGVGGTGTLRLDTNATNDCWAGQRLQATINTKAAGYTASTVRVDQNSIAPSGWDFWQETNPEMVIPGTFVSGPATAPLGVGSAQFSVTGTTQATSVRTPAYAGTKLDTLRSLAYSVYSATGVSPSLAFDVNYNGEGGYSGRLVYEPIYDPAASVTPSTWHTYDVLNGQFWASKQTASGNRCQQSGPGANPLVNSCSLSQILAIWPNATISGNLVMQLGSGSPATTVDVDNVTIGISGSTGAITETTFDFEPIVAPRAPTSVVAVAGNASATVSFVAPASNGGSAITGYVAAPTTGPGTCVVTGLTAACTGLVNGTPVTISVYAVSAIGNGVVGVSNSVTPTAPVVPPSATVPGAPTAVVATVGDASASLTWTAPASNGGSAITGYTAVPTAGAGTCVVTGTAAACTGLTNGTAYTFTVKAVNAVGSSAAAVSNSVTPGATPPPPGALDFNAAGPRRVFDTRPGESPNALRVVAKAKVGNGNVLKVKLTDLAGLVPSSGVGAVSLNVTATNAAASGFVTVFPCGTQPFVSSVNFTPAKNVANAVIAPVAADGSVCFFSSQAVDLVVDANGWFAAGTAFVPAGPARLLDTRAGSSPEAVIAVPKAKIAGGSVLTVQMTGIAGLLPANGVDTVSLNVTAVNPEAAGFITVFPCGTRDEVSSVNYAAGQTVANAVLATVSDAGKVCFFSSQSTDLVVDINGYLVDPSAFTGVSPKRVFDTRPGFSPNAVRTVSKTKIGGTTVLEVKLTDIAGAVPASGVSAVSLNVTAVNPELDGFVTVYPCGTRPDSSSVNYSTGETVANAVITPVSATGTVCFFSQNLTDLVVDVNGWFSTTPS